MAAGAHRGDVDFDENGPTGNTVLEFHDSMTTLVQKVFSGQINPGQLKIVRDIVSDGAAASDIDTAVYSDVRANYSFSARADGTLVVSNTGGLDPLDGTDLLRNMERLQFSDGTLGIVVGTAVQRQWPRRRRARRPTTGPC